MSQDRRAPPSRPQPGASTPPPSSRREDDHAPFLSMLVRFMESALAQGRGSRAVLALGRRTQSEIERLGRAAGGELRVTFTEEAVFVGGRPVAAPREVLGPAIELGRLFNRQGIVEMGLRADLSVDALLDLSELLGATIRDPGQMRLVTEAGEGITLRPGARPASTGITTADRAVDLYLAGLLRLRAYYDRAAQGPAPPLRDLKLLAQDLVSLHEIGGGLLLGLTAFAGVHRDDAGRALQAAILCVAAAARLSPARLTLSRFALAALLSGAGRARLRRTLPAGARFPEELDAAVPAESAAISVAAGAVQRASALRTTTVWEAAWIPRESKLGRLHGGKRAPLWQSRILATARAFLDRVAPRDASRTASALEALEDLGRAPGTDRDALRLLVHGLLAEPLAA
ncbi:MAG: hypothetical protein U0359_23200 [Byssovorax sp.]